MTNQTQLGITTELMQDIMNYLTKRPYIEVHTLVARILQETSPKPSTPAPVIEMVPTPAGAPLEGQPNAN